MNKTYIEFESTIFGICFLLINFFFGIYGREKPLYDWMKHNVGTVVFN